MYRRVFTILTITIGLASMAGCGREVEYSNIQPGEGNSSDGRPSLSDGPVDTVNPNETDEIQVTPLDGEFKDQEVDNQCYTATGQVIAGQFADKAGNSGPAQEDCFNSQGTLVYPGEKPLSCLEDLKAKYPGSIIYPVQTLFPNLYREAMGSSGDQEQYLVDKLSASSCALLLQNEQ